MTTMLADDCANKTTPKLDHVRMSQSSRRDAKGHKDINSITVALDQIDEEIHQCRVSRIEYQSELSKLNAIVRSGTRLEGREYRDICNRQAEIKKAISMSEVRTSELRTQKKEPS